MRLWTAANRRHLRFLWTRAFSDGAIVDLSRSSIAIGFAEESGAKLPHSRSAVASPCTKSNADYRIFRVIQTPQREASTSTVSRSGFSVMAWK